MIMPDKYNNPLLDTNTNFIFTIDNFLDKTIEYKFDQLPVNCNLHLYNNHIDRANRTLSTSAPTYIKDYYSLLSQYGYDKIKDLLTIDILRVDTLLDAISDHTANVNSQPHCDDFWWRNAGQWTFVYYVWQEDNLDSSTVFYTNLDQLDIVHEVKFVANRLLVFPSCYAHSSNLKNGYGKRVIFSMFGEALSKHNANIWANANYDNVLDNHMR